MAKKEARRAVRQAQRKNARVPGQPTWFRAVIMALVLSGLYLVLMEYVVKAEGRTLANNLFWAGIFFAVYTVFIYYWENYLFRRRRRKQEERR